MLELLMASVAAHGEALEHAEPTAFGLNPGGWVALAMIVVFGVMIWKGVPAMIAKALDAQIAGIREQLNEAKSLREEAEALKAEYQGKADAAGEEAKAILERARMDAKGIVAKAKTDAEALVERRGKMAEDKIAAEERAAIEEVRAIAAKAATAAAAALIAARNDASNDKALTDRAIAGL